MTAAFERLAAGAAALGVSLQPGQLDRLLEYLGLIAKWNRVYNLTAVRDPDEMLTQHLLDSLAVLPALAREWPGAGRLLDVGSGAGLPGVVIALVRPDLQVDCVDTVGKKAAFIQQAAVQLQLANLRGVHDRVEHLAGEYDIVTSRAFASLADFVALSSGVLQPAGIWMAMKGRLPSDEIAALPSETDVFHVEQLSVPDLAAERCLVWMRRKVLAGAGSGGTAEA